MRNEAHKLNYNFYEHDFRPHLLYSATHFLDLRLVSERAKERSTLVLSFFSKFKAVCSIRSAELLGLVGHRFHYSNTCLPMSEDISEISLVYE